MRKIILLTSLLLTACGPLTLPNLGADTPNKTSAGTETQANADLGANLGANLGSNVDANVDASADVKIPSPEEIASFTGMKASACSEEGSLKSQQGAATSVKFTNSSDAQVTVYWLNAQGQRKEYKKLAAGQSYTQATYVTHPWLIANAQDQCLGIYTSTSPDAVSLDIQQSVELSSETSTTVVGDLGSVTEDNVTEARVRQGLACLKAKGDTQNAQAVQGLLNVYLQMKPAVGETIATKGYLTGTVSVFNKTGC